MQLTLSDVVRLFDVPERQVYRWIREDELPAQIINARYRFNRAELLEWATARGVRLSSSIFSASDGEIDEGGELLDALEYGGVKHLAMGAEEGGLRTLFQRILDDMPLPESFHREQLIDLLMARQSVGTTGVGDGIAIPHARYPVLLSVPRPAIRLCFLSQPIDLNAPDGKPVDTLFIIVCATVHEHLRLLAKLAGLLRGEDFRRFLRTRPQQPELLAEIARQEAALIESRRSVPEDE